MPTYVAPAGTHIGHVHLKVSNIEQSVLFYNRVLGFDVVWRLSDSAAFLSAGGYHHHIGLNTWESKNGDPAPIDKTGLYHFAINYPTRKDLAAAYKSIIDSGWQIDGASDHGTHEAIYLHDPDEIGIELAWDREEKFWPKTVEEMMNSRKPLNFKTLLAELE